MRKVLVGLLALVALFFAAANARLSQRQRVLEAKLAALEARPAVKPCPKVAPVPTPEPTPAPAAPAAPAATPAPSPTVKAIDQAQEFFGRVVNDVLDGVVRTKWVMKTRRDDADLALSESQKQAIEALRKSRDQQSQVYRDEIRKIDEQTELAIRQLLDGEQRKKYDGEKSGTLQLDADSFVLAAPQEALPQAQSPGFLGVTANDAQGGGAAIAEVVEGSAASQFGLQKGDVILEVDSNRIGAYIDLATKLQATPAGTAVTLKIKRGDAEFYQSVKLGSRK